MWLDRLCVAMNILFTGGSSFTGFWFIRALHDAGHDVTATFRQEPNAYGDSIRRERVMLATTICTPIYGLSFGDDAFIDLIRRQGWDVLCHHAADVANYKSPDFDVITALSNNTYNLPTVLMALKEVDCRRVLLTGSVFEHDEGAGSQRLPDFYPYGLSKALTADVFRYYCARDGIGLGKFVIPNPFGPYEEPRFTTYLMKQWLDGRTPSCSNPRYVRDNIPVTLLAKAYADFIRHLPDTGFVKINPSGYAESQGAFTRRLAQAMQPRLGLPCHVDLKDQTDFPEPRVRINTDVLDEAALCWDESVAWDEMAQYYQIRFAK